MKLTLIRRTRIETVRFRIAHFSTSHSYGSRRQEEEARNVRVSVWWDVESCNIPVGGFNGYRIVHSITNALRANGIRGPLQISAFGNVMKIPRGTQEALSSTGISLTHLPGGKEKDCVNRSMIIELMYWASQHPPPAHIFMITGDHGMASVLHRLRMSNYNILLAGPEDASIALCSAASIMWQWNALLTGENLVGKHFNQPPDGPSGSWYGTYRVPLESPLPAIEKKDSEPAESEVEDVVQDIPAEVTEQIQRILISYPNGVSIATLRQELSSNIIVDKNMYGYKKFSSLLLAMPQILELCPREHGQHLVRTVSSKAPVSTDSPMKASENSIVSDTDTNCKAPPTEIEIFEDKMPLESTEELCTLNPLLMTNEKSKLIESDHQYSPICNEQPLLKEECDGPPINVQDVESGSNSGSSPTKKQENASEGGIFQRTWTKWFGDANNDAAEQKEGNRSVQHGQSNYSRSFDAVAASDVISDKVDNSNGGVGKILKFCSRVLYGFKTDGIGSEAADAGMYSSDVLSQVAQHSLMNDAFSKDGFWSEMKAFLCSPEGENIVSKSISRQQMAWAMKNEGPSLLSSLGDDDLLHLVNLLIDDKNWIKECLSKTSPFKVTYASVKLLEKSSDLNVKSSMLSDKMQQSDSQSERECVVGSTNKFSSRLTSTESSEEIKSRMLADCQKLLDAIVKTHPEGYNLSGFRKLFFERYSYCLKLNYLEFDKLTSLINTMSGVKLKGYVIYPSENSPSSTPATHSDSSDSQFDEQLGPLKSLDKKALSSPPRWKPKTDKEPLLRYEPCSEADIYTDSDVETNAKGRPTEEAPKAHKEVSALIDILSNWEANKDVARNCNPSETAPKEDLQNPIKCHSPGEVSRKTLRNTAQKWKLPKRTFNFVSDDHINEGAVKDTTEARQQC